MSEYDQTVGVVRRVGTLGGSTARREGQSGTRLSDVSYNATSASELVRRGIIKLNSSGVFALQWLCLTSSR